MIRARAGALAAAALAVAVVGSAGAASAAKVKGTPIVDKAKGYGIVLPATWELIPRSQSQVDALIARLKKTKSTVALAKYYQALVSTPAGKTGLTAYRLQAFAWPVPANASPLPTELSIQVATLPKALTTADFPSLGSAYASNFTGTKGAKVSKPKTIKLPAGKAEFLEATVPAGEGLTYGYALFLIPHGKTLYNLTFQVDSRELANATLFASIAGSFGFIKTK
jgi:hypothetical protein